MLYEGEHQMLGHMSVTEPRTLVPVVRPVASSHLAAIRALGLYFLFFVQRVSLFACAQIVAARQEEAAQQLEMLLSLPVSRRRWFTGRLTLAAAGMFAALALSKRRDLTGH
jgi:putative exporter of polyketide antibiotics